MKIVSAIYNGQSGGARVNVQGMGKSGASETEMVSAEPAGAGSAANRRRRRSRAEITDALLQAAREEFNGNGFSGATTAAIARRADVTEAQLFRCFGSKSALFRAAIFEPLNRHFAEFHDKHRADGETAPDLREQARLYITELQQFIAEHNRMLVSLIVAQTYGHGDGNDASGIDSITAYFDRGAAMMTQRIDTDDVRVDPRLMVRLSFAAVLASVAFKDWMFPKGLASDEAISEAIVDFVLDGISANAELG